MKKKKILIIVALVVILVLITPIRLNLKDGGSVQYKSVLYEVTKLHRLNHEVDGVKPYIDGYIVKILGIKVFEYTY